MQSLFTIQRSRRPGLRRWLWLLAFVFAMQGLGQSVVRIATPAHGHRAAAGDVAVARDAGHEAFMPPARDGHRSIPWIGAQAGHAHAMLGAPAHAHPYDDASVVYLDADGDAADAAPAVVALGPPPGAPVAHARPEGHAAWARAPGWHALACTSAPPERPPRGATVIA